MARTRATDLESRHLVTESAKKSQQRGGRGGPTPTPHRLTSPAGQGCSQRATSTPPADRRDVGRVAPSNHKGGLTSMPPSCWGSSTPAAWRQPSTATLLGAFAPHTLAAGWSSQPPPLCRLPLLRFSPSTTHHWLPQPPSSQPTLSLSPHALRD